MLPWMWRALPSALVASAAAWAAHSQLVRTGPWGTLVMAGVATTVAVLLYLWGVKDIIKDLPFGPRVTRILSAVRLV